MDNNLEEEGHKERLTEESEHTLANCMKGIPLRVCAHFSSVSSFSFALCSLTILLYLLFTWTSPISSSSLSISPCPDDTSKYLFFQMFLFTSVHMSFSLELSCTSDKHKLVERKKERVTAQTTSTREKKREIRMTHQKRSFFFLFLITLHQRPFLSHPQPSETLSFAADRLKSPFL